MATGEKEQVTATAASASGAAKDGLPRLTWASKPTTVERVALPFQVVETINESRATREAERGSLFSASGAGKTATGWRNKLIWGDNKLVMGSLLQDFAGQIDLIYIDPPFATGDDFSLRIRVGDTNVMKQPSVLEEHAYRDTWGRGYSSYLSMMYERLSLMHELLADNGSIYVHCDWRMNSYLRMLMDEVFGPDRIVNEIIWRRAFAHNDPARCGNIHDTLLFYSKSEQRTWNTVLQPPDPEYVEQFFDQYDEERQERYARHPLDAPRHGSGGNLIYEWKGAWPAPNRTWAYVREKMEELDREGRIHYPKKGMPRLKRFESEYEGTAIQDLWIDINKIHNQSREQLHYPTQKPEALLDRIIRSSSNEDDLVADFFVGSGTTAAVAEKLNRRWIVADLGRFAVHTTRKRLLDIPDCKFTILNLGLYERQHWQEATAGSVRQYLDFILALYNAQPVDDFETLHGKKGDRVIHIGAVDAPVTTDEIEQVMDELAANDLRAADVLGWEWEMGLHDVVSEQARRRGLDVACRQIPREVMKAQLDDEVRFFELAYLDLEVDRNARSVRVQLRDFIIPSEELIPEDVRSKIAQWSDYIDYWSVDFNFRDDTFHNEWQTYRTREEPNLATETDWHDYDESGRYLIVIKVIDIFGNDTTKLAEVQIK